MSVSATTVGWGLAAAFIGYLLGAIPVGVIVARVSGIDDPRTHDSTHTGTTNVFRTAGPILGLVVFVGDAGKGVAAAWVGTMMAGAPGLVLAGTLAVIGHCWSVFIGWEGGMGLATAAGLLVWISPAALIVEVFVLLALYYLLRDRYLTAILGVPAAPIILQSIAVPSEYVVLSLTVAATLVWRFWRERSV